MKNKRKNFLRTYGRSSENSADPVESTLSPEEEMEKITNDLIRDTVGELGVITKEFEKRGSGYSAKDNPISEKEAEELMLSLIRIAVSRRKLLNERIPSSVEAGGLFQRYYGKLHRVSKLAVACTTRKRAMENAEKERDYYEKMKRKVRECAFEDFARPEDDGECPPLDGEMFPQDDD